MRSGRRWCRGGGAWWPCTGCRLLADGPHRSVAARLGVAPNTLTFHLDRLRHAALVTVRRDGRSMIYAARFDAMKDLLGFLTDDCCGGQPDICQMTRPAAQRSRKAKICD